jgi:hypothetical protein
MKHRSSFTQIVAVVALYAVLGQSLWAVTNQQCIFGQKCFGGSQYNTMQVSSTSLTNLTYRKVLPAKAQMLAGAAQIMAYANQELNNGDIAVVQAQFLNALEAFYKAQPNATRGYQTMVAYGGTVPQSALQTAMSNVTMAERQAAAAFIQQNGLYAFLAQVASVMTYLADNGLGVHHGQEFNMQWARLWVDAGVIVGTVLAAGTGVAEAIGLGLLIGAAVSTFYLDAIE